MIAKRYLLPGKGEAFIALVAGISVGVVMNKARTKRGGEFVRADFSDTTGQFSAACFEESLVPQFEQWAAEGACLLLNVELDSPNPGEPPRLTVRGARPLEAVSGSTPMQLRFSLHSHEALADLKLELSISEEAQGEIVAQLWLEDERHAFVRLGTNFVLNGELAERLATVEGIDNVELQPIRGRAALKLVA